MEKVRIGIIGSGSISHSHMDGYRQLSNVEVVAACDINEGRVREYAAQYGIPHTFTDYNEMVKMKELDAVSVCTWNCAHAGAAIAALNAGKHVLCEKPLAMTVAEARAMEQAAQKAGRLLAVGFVMRFERKADVLADLIAAGRIGQIYFAKAAYLRRAGSPGGWFADKKRSGGGPLIDLGVHIIDISRYLMGNPKAVSVSGATFDMLGERSNIKGVIRYTASDNSDVCDVEDMAVAFIRFDNGAVLEVETSYSQHIEKDASNIQFFGAKGGFNYEPDLKIYTEMDNYLMDLTPQIDLGEDDSFRREIAHFVDCVSGKAVSRAPAADGVEIMKILCAVYESARLGREVLL